MALTANAELHFAFGPSVRLQVEGSGRARGHFAREYGPSVPADGPADVEAEIRAWRPGPRSGPRRQAVGGHKTARWRVELSEPERRPLGVRIALAGGPPSFALSLVQGYYVEPLVAVALARAGFVALPSAGVVGPDGALVLLGRSGSGKSSVSVRALAAGRSILGDDQVVIHGGGGCWPYPRRLRLYPDVQDTAPEAWSRLRASTRRTLRFRRALRRATRGCVAPSLAVAAKELGGRAHRGPVTVARVVVVARSDAVARLTERPRDAEWAVQEAVAVLEEQRRVLRAAADAGWAATLAEAGEREAGLVREWLAHAPVSSVSLPLHWDAPTAVRALAEQVGIG